MDRLRRIGNVENRITELLHKIPGYSGYRDKENWRDEDKRLRESIADNLQQGVHQLTQYNADLSSQRKLEHLSRMETLVDQIRLLADRIRTASYGYGGIFTDREVDGAALDQLRLFDHALQREVTGLEARIATVTGSVPPRDEDVLALSKELDRIRSLFDSRSGVIDEAKPDRSARVLELLESNDRTTPSPLLNVRKGDTLSLLGDNFIANASISIATDQGPLHLVRVSEDENGATWLLGSGVDGIPSARLSESVGEIPPYQTMQRASATLDTENGRQENLAIQYAARMTGEGQLELSVVFGNSSRTYRGNEIRDIDVEVYGAA